MNNEKNKIFLSQIPYLIGFSIVLYFSNLVFGLTGSIHEAVKTADEDRIYELLDANPLLVNSTFSYGLTPENYNMTPLHWAARMGYENIAKILIARKANINAQTSTGRTPLHMACIRGYKNIVELLIAKGADINIKDNFGSTPLHYAVTNGSLDVIKLLIRHNANIIDKDNSGNTSIHLASLFGKNAVIKLFYSENKDFTKMLSLKNILGNSPLHLAVEGKKPKTIELLINLGANIEEKNYNGETPLHLAVKNLDYDSVKDLLKRGANANALDNNNNTPLTLLAITAYNKISITKSKKLESFIRNELKKITIELLKNKANPYIDNKNGVNFIHLASNVLNKADIIAIVNDFYK